MEGEELSWFLAFIILALITTVLTIYQYFFSPILNQLFLLFIFQIPTILALIAWLITRLKAYGKRNMR
ncbi:MAG: hypothetical protein B6U65_01770 [Candidatus Wolframiiraptor sp. EX4484-121]|nr:MAG: hypothetical protein B6U65_01770 [Candidatus Wolframiiraptor sp. EX4484-121]